MLAFFSLKTKKIDHCPKKSLHYRKTLKANVFAVCNIDFQNVCFFPLFCTGSMSLK